MIILFMSDERADTDNRVVDVLWKLVAQCLPDFFVRLASKTIGSSVPAISGTVSRSHTMTWRDMSGAYAYRVAI
jgi:hypothetical protein